MRKYKKLEIKSKHQLRNWLEKNHEHSENVWLVSYKKSNPKFYVSWSDMVDELLCFGWIDSVIRKLDEQRTMRLISKRKSKSVWSLVNKKKVAILLKEGLIAPMGLKAIQEAKKDGSWDYLNDIDQMIIPDDLTRELKKYPKANDYFEAFPGSVKRSILYWIKSARRSETRENRIIKVAFLASEDIRATQL